SPVYIEKRRVLQPRSERTRRFDLFKKSSRAFLEFAQTPTTEDGIKGFADRYGPLDPGIKAEGLDLFEDLDLEVFDRALDDNAQPVEPDRTESRPFGGDIFSWSTRIREMHRAVELWELGTSTGDFSKIIRRVKKSLALDLNEGVSVHLLLKEDP